MKILIVCVNYNSYSELRQFLDSVEKSAENATDAHVEVIIADNSTLYEDVDVTSFQTISVSQQKFDNLGYLGGASAVINNTQNISQYKYVIISNVDVLFEGSTIKHLVDFNIGNDVAWVAPTIYSEKFQKDLNPNIINRYPKQKLRLLKLTYNKWVYGFYCKYYYSRKHKDFSYPQCDIYAGHGSCIVLTSNFFSDYERIDYPIFLYGEELFIAELIRKPKKRVIYVPTIRIKTIGGVSTSKLPSKSFCKYNIEAINYILKTFY